MLLQLFFLQLLAQTAIKGKVVDGKNLAIATADVALFKLADKRMVTAALTDEHGHFSLLVTADPKLCYLVVTATGYLPKTLPIHSVDAIRIELVKDTAAKQLAEVTIMARKKAIAMKGDRMVFDIAQLGLSGANNGLEVMQQLPGVGLDKDENIRYRGSTGIQIMINGRKSMLQGDALREFIRSLKSEDIKSVEIISQPSARYEATGTTGILNIVLKRNTTQALGGNAYTSASYGQYLKTKTGGRFFYNDEQWSINSSGSYGNGKSFNDRSVEQTILLGSNVRNLTQHNYWLPKTESGSFNVAAERKLGKKQLLSTEWQLYREVEQATTTGLTLDDLNGQRNDEVRLTQLSSTPATHYSGNLFYNYTADSATTKIDAQLNYGNYQTSISGSQKNEYATGAIDELSGFNETGYHLMNAQLDWSQKLAKQLNLEAGAKFSRVNMDYDNQYQAIQGGKQLIPDSLMVNDFSYLEKLGAAYSQLNYTSGKWNLLVGLRMENYRYKATSRINHQSNADRYTNWFPSASVNYEEENHQYRMSYSRRIARPGYLMLNPYFQYIDAYSVERGNPALKPQFYHSFELNYIYKNALSFSLYGYLYQGRFVSVIDYQNSKNYNILYESNAADGSRFGFSASVPYQAAKWYTMQYTLDAYLQAENSEIPAYAYNGKGYGYEVNMYHRFNLPHAWVITLNGFLTGRNRTPTGYAPVIYDISSSVRKSLMKEKIQVSGGCTNILKKSMSNSYSTVGNVSTHWVNKWETRKFYLQLTYRFGGTKEKKVKRTSLDDEQERM